MFNSLSNARSALLLLCSKCKEVKCRRSKFSDGYGQWLDRSSACYNDYASVVVMITDTCPCIYPGNMISNKRVRVIAKRCRSSAACMYTSSIHRIPAEDCTMTPHVYPIPHVYPTHPLPSVHSGAVTTCITWTYLFGHTKRFASHSVHIDVQSQHICCCGTAYAQSTI